MIKKWGLCIILFLICTGYTYALAEGPINPFFSVTQPIVLPIKTRAAGLDVTIPEEISTGVPATFTVNTEASLYYYSVLSPVKPGSSTYQYLYYTVSGTEDSFLTYQFYAPGNYWLKIEAVNASGTTVRGNFFFDVAGDDLLAMKVREIITECPADGEFETVLWLHDYLTHHAYYDLELTRYGADGVLMEGRGVCDSYSKAFEMLLTAAGLQSKRMLSSTHSWNAVMMEGEWYQIDVTWDDPACFTQTVSGLEGHDYFGLPNDIIFQISDHVPQNNDYPQCTSIACNYGVRTGEMPWHEAVITAITEHLDAYESSFTIALNNTFQDGNRIRWINEPILYYGISARVLNTEGILYRDHEMVLSISDEGIEQFICQVEAHYQITSEYSFVIRSAEIRKEAFRGSGADSVKINDGCISIGKYAFADMVNMTEIFIPESVIIIYPTAFSGCSPNLLIVTETGSSSIELAKEKGYCLEILIQ